MGRIAAWPRIAIAVLALGCANGGSLAPRGGDGGARTDAARADAGSLGMDAAAEEDAGSGSGDAGAGDAGSIDAGSIDAGRDAGSIDAGRDAGRDSGPIDAGRDSGRDAGIDGGRCMPESCNGADDDCDGTIDDGFRAAVVNVSYATELAARHAPCDGVTSRWSPDCNAAMHRFCAARGCTTSGFGPDESGGDRADVTCVLADVISTSYGELAMHHAGCTSAAVWGTDCNAAIHRDCVSRGYPSGFGPVEHSGEGVAFSCLRAATVVATSYSTLVTHHDGCNGSTQRIGPECNAAIHRFCRSRGHVSGLGPVENSGDTAYVACVDP